MLFRHEWGSPGIVYVQQAGRPVATPQEACVKCGTSRNPLTMELIRKSRKADWCLDAPPATEQPNRARRLRWLRFQLDAIEADGADVDREYGRKPRTVPELPLAYKD